MWNVYQEPFTLKVSYSIAIIANLTRSHSQVEHRNFNVKATEHLFNELAVRMCWYFKNCILKMYILWYFVPIFFFFVQFMWTPPIYQYVLLISDIIFSLNISFCFCKSYVLKMCNCQKKKKKKSRIRNTLSYFSFPSCSSNVFFTEYSRFSEENMSCLWKDNPFCFQNLPLQASHTRKQRSWHLKGSKSLQLFAKKFETTQPRDADRELKNAWWV